MVAPKPQVPAARTLPWKVQWHTSRPHYWTCWGAEAAPPTPCMVQFCSFNNMWQLNDNYICWLPVHMSLQIPSSNSCHLKSMGILPPTQRDFPNIPLCLKQTASARAIKLLWSPEDLWKQERWTSALRDAQKPGSLRDKSLKRQHEDREVHLCMSENYQMGEIRQKNEIVIIAESPYCYFLPTKQIIETPVISLILSPAYYFMFYNATSLLNQQPP